MNGYSKNVIQGKRNPGFVKRLQRDHDDLAHAKLPKGPVYISNSTDPLQERLETKYRDKLPGCIFCYFQVARSHFVCSSDNGHQQEQAEG